MAQAEVLERLYSVIEERRQQRPEGSYVVQLLDGGVDAIAEKIREEGEEVIEAAAAGEADHVAREVADLIFHTWVMMAAAGTKPDDVFAVLERRFGTGGQLGGRKWPRSQRGRERVRHHQEA